MASFQIGSFEFLRFTTPIPPQPKAQFSIETKPGVDGFAAIYTGKVGEPFTIEAESAFSNFAAAVAAAKSYENSPSLTPVAVLWESVDLAATYNVNFLLQSVSIRSIQAVPMIMSPAAVYAGGVIVQSTWTLIPRAI